MMNAHHVICGVLATSLVLLGRPVHAQDQRNIIRGPSPFTIEQVGTSAAATQFSGGPNAQESSAFIRSPNSAVTLVQRGQANVIGLKSDTPSGVGTSININQNGSSLNSNIDLALTSNISPTNVKVSQNGQNQQINFGAASTLDAASVTMNQSGANHLIQIGIDGTGSETGNGSLSVKQAGSATIGNTATVRMARGLGSGDSISIDQNGDRNSAVISSQAVGAAVATLSQIGTGNQIYIAYGAGSTAEDYQEVNQSGSYNYAEIIMNGSASRIEANQSGNDNRFRIESLGIQNTININQTNIGNMTGNSAHINLGVTPAALSTTLYGMPISPPRVNSVTTNQNGSANDLMLIAYGSYNTVDLTQVGNNNKMTSIVVGDSNAITMNQNNGQTGLVGHNATLEVRGSHNTVNFAQTGTTPMTNTVKLQANNQNASLSVSTGGLVDGLGTSLPNINNTTIAPISLPLISR